MAKPPMKHKCKNCDARTLQAIKIGLSYYCDKRCHNESIKKKPQAKSKTVSPRKTHRPKITPIRESARREDCALQIHPWCNQSPETTVLAHINCEDKGTALKSPDYHAVYACSDCHDIIDGKRQVDLPKIEILRCILRGLYRTHKRLIEKGLMKI